MSTVTHTTKRHKPEIPTINPDCNGCCYYVSRKHRFCRSERAKNSLYCPTHSNNNSNIINSCVDKDEMYKSTQSNKLENTNVSVDDNLRCECDTHNDYKNDADNICNLENNEKEHTKITTTTTTTRTHETDNYTTESNTNVESTNSLLETKSQEVATTITASSSSSSSAVESRQYENISSSNNNNKKHCNNNVITIDMCTKSNKERVPCPINPNHTVYASRLSKHVKVCPDLRFVTNILPYYEKDRHAFRGILYCYEDNREKKKNNTEVDENNSECSVESSSNQYVSNDNRKVDELKRLQNITCNYTSSNSCENEKSNIIDNVNNNNNSSSRVQPQEMSKSVVQQCMHEVNTGKECSHDQFSHVRKYNTINNKNSDCVNTPIEGNKFYKNEEHNNNEQQTLIPLLSLQEEQNLLESRTSSVGNKQEHQQYENVLVVEEEEEQHYRTHKRKLTHRDFTPEALEKLIQRIVECYEQYIAPNILSIEQLTALSSSSSSSSSCLASQLWRVEQEEYNINTSNITTNDNNNKKNSELHVRQEHHEELHNKSQKHSPQHDALLQCIACVIQQANAAFVSRASLENCRQSEHVVDKQDYMQCDANSIINNKIYNSNNSNNSNSNKHNIKDNIMETSKYKKTYKQTVSEQDNKSNNNDNNTCHKDKSDKFLINGFVEMGAGKASLSVALQHNLLRRSYLSSGTQQSNVSKDMLAITSSESQASPFLSASTLSLTLQRKRNAIENKRNNNNNNNNDSSNASNDNWYDTVNEQKDIANAEQEVTRYHNIATTNNNNSSSSSNNSTNRNNNVVTEYEKSRNSSYNSNNNDNVMYDEDTTCEHHEHYEEQNLRELFVRNIFSSHVVLYPHLLVIDYDGFRRKGDAQIQHSFLPLHRLRINIKDLNLATAIDASYAKHVCKTQHYSKNNFSNNNNNNNSNNKEKINNEIDEDCITVTERIEHCDIINNDNNDNEEEKKMEHVTSIHAENSSDNSKVATDTRAPAAVKTTNHNTLTYVVMGKHLCGACADFALSCFTNINNDTNNKEELTSAHINICGVVIATCCHHRCELQHMNFVNEVKETVVATTTTAEIDSPLLPSANHVIHIPHTNLSLTQDEFAALTTMSS